MNNSVRGTRLEGRFTDGQSFLNEFEQQLGDWSEFVQTHPANLTDEIWRQRQCIEYLFVDAMKSWELCNAIHRNFFPYLEPGRSYVHHQDYMHFYTYWIHLVTFRMRDYLTPVDHGHMGGSRVFRYTREMPQVLYAEPYELASFTTEEVEDAFAYSFSFVPEAGHPNLAAARIKLCLDTGDRELARRLLDEATATYGTAGQRSELARVHQLIS